MLRTISIVVTAALAAALAHPPRIRAQAATSLTDLLARVGAYVADYQRAFAALVSDERYTQVVRQSTPIVMRTRSLQSEYASITVGDVWLGFRDVLRVDGSPVRDRDSRLAALFLTPTPDLLKQAQAIYDEGARFNIGPVKRTINYPTLAMSFLKQDQQSRSVFRLGGEASIDGVRTRIIDFIEKARPSAIRSADGKGDVETSGRVWIDAVTGRVIQTELQASPGSVKATITVHYAEQPRLLVWPPVSMRERYDMPNGDNIDGAATYSNFRAFDVAVSTIIK